MKNKNTIAQHIVSLKKGALSLFVCSLFIPTTTTAASAEEFSSPTPLGEFVTSLSKDPNRCVNYPHCKFKGGKI